MAITIPETPKFFQSSQIAPETPATPGLSQILPTIPEESEPQKCTQTTSEVNNSHTRPPKIPEKPKILRRPQVEDRTGLSRSTIYLYIKEGTFPKPIKLGDRAVGWLEHEIVAWLIECIENRNKMQEVKA